MALALALLATAAGPVSCLWERSPQQAQEPAALITAAPTEAPTEAPVDAPTDPPSGMPSQSAERIVGTWEASVDLAERVRAVALKDQTGILGSIDFSEAFFDIRAVFNEDGTYESQIDAQSYRAACASVSAQIAPAMKEYMLLLASDGYFAEQGADEQTILKELGISSWDELGDKMLAEMVNTAWEAERGGEYGLAGSRLRLLERNEESRHTESYITVGFSGDIMRFESAQGGEAGAFGAALLPLEFHRAG